MKIKFCGKLLLLFLLGVLQTNAQDSLQQAVNLKEITLDAVRINSPKRILPFSLSYRAFEAEQLGIPQNSLQDYLKTVPGLFAQNSQNFAQDLRLSIRGFGARSGFGIRGIQLIVDGIPETTPDGQGQLDNLPLGLIQSISVLRGPAATFYGNAAGGVIQINTLDGFKTDFVRIRAQGGSYSSSNLSATVGLKNNKTKAVLFQNISQSEGYRNHSQYKQQVFNANVWHDFSEESRIRWQFNYTHSPYAYDAGGINMASVEENRIQARPQNESYKTFEVVDHIKTGVQWDNQISEKLRWESYVFYAFRDFEGKIPIKSNGYIDLVRNYYGLGSALEFQPNNHHRMQVRFSTANQKDLRKRYQNLSGTQGDNVLDQAENFYNTALSFLDEIKWDFGLVRAGLRYDYQRFGTQNSVDEVRLHSLNPSLGFTYTQLGNHVLFTSYSSSFETPTLNELSANPDGSPGFNADLSPSKAHNFELGWRFITPENTFEATLYAINTDDEILPYEMAEYPGRDFYRNAGKTSRRGIELYWEHQKKAWLWTVAYNFSAIKFDDYVLGDKNLSGNHLPGIPQQQLGTMIQYRIPSGWRLGLQTEYTGELYADDANLTQVADYFLANFRLSKSMGRFSFFGGINNLLNRAYFDNIRINAYGKRYYEPAPLRNTYLGVNINL